jgi:hypothetical protein
VVEPAVEPEPSTDPALGLVPSPSTNG